MPQNPTSSLNATPAELPGVDTEDVLAFPASSGQRRLWFIDQAEPGTSLYNVSSCVRLYGVLNVDALQAALNEIVRRHEVLRTTFEVAEGEPIQVVHAPLPLSIDVEDVSGLPADDREPRARHLVASASRQPFDLTFGPLVRANLFRLASCDHVLLLTLHHIITDGWSIGVLFNELAEVYNATVEGRESSLAELSLQYGDFAVWEQEHLEDAAVRESLAHWTRTLAGAPVLNLPADRPRPARPSPRGATASRTIPPALADGVRALARRHDTTLFMTGLAMFAALLHRYGGDEDIVLGSAIANRDRVEFQPLMGFFVNTLAFRLNLAGDPTVRELLQHARQVTLDGFRHQDVPFEKVVEALRPDRKGGTSPVFQAMYAFESEWSPAPFRVNGLTASTWPLESDTAKFDLTLFFTDRPPGMATLLEFSTDLFDQATAERLLGHFEQALVSAIEHPDQPVSRLALVTQAERRQLVEWNRTAAEYPRDAAIPDLVAQQVARRPEATAIVEGDRRTSYRELNRYADNLAARLRRLGVGRGVAVSLCASRGTNLIAAMLGVLKAGGAYVPLDPVYPRERLAALVADVGARVAVVESKDRDLFDAGVTVLDLDTALAGDEVPFPSPGVGGADPAYIIYTSGSTGRPKGAIVPHRGIARLLVNTDYVQLTESDVIAQVSNAAFDAATFEIWGALLAGASLAIVPTDAVFSARRIAAEIERSGITAMFLTTSLFNQIVREDPGVFRSMRYLLFGGEAADPAAVVSVLEAGGPQHLLNVYGPTETTTFATTFEATTAADIRSGVPIGRPIANTTVHILDRHMNPVPVGVPGELYIGGDGVALGYHARPELTAERFVADPFSSQESARLYRTGDLVKYRADGVIEFLGRLDNQVKIRGFRVEPGEIEAALRAIRGVDDACVLADKDQAGIVRLTAYVGAPGTSHVTSASVRDALKETLPSYMVPAEITVLDALPINANGKVDRSALRAADLRSSAGAPVFVSARDPLEAMLVEIWERLLGVQPIGVRDDFFELGGHSLLAARMIGEVEQATGRRLSLSGLLQHATIESLGDVLVKAEHPCREARFVRLNESTSRRPLFFLHGDMNGGGFYTRALARHLDPERPLFVAAPAGTGGGAVPPSIQSMAAIEIEKLRALQPHGPYLLGGYCNGGLVALEVARLLRERGEEVPLVAIVSVSAASTRLEPLDRLIRAWATWRGLTEAERVRLFVWFQPIAERLAHATGRERFAYLAAKIGRLVKRARGKRGNRHDHIRAVPLRETDRMDAARHVPEVYAAYYNAVAAYVPCRYDGRVVLLLTGDPRELEHVVADWRRRIPRIEMHPIEGDHTSCITRHVASLAKTLRDCLASVEEPAEVLLE